MHRRGLLLDRDGVINRDEGYVGKREDFIFMPGLFPFLRHAQDLGFSLCILTNQSGVGRGLYSLDDYEKLTAWMLAELSAEGITLDLVLASFTHPEAVNAEYRRSSYWRKPNPGMVMEAIRRLRLNPLASVFLGDHTRDMQAATRGGIGTRLYLSAEPVLPPEMPKVVTVVGDFDEARLALDGCVKSFVPAS